MTDLRGSWRYPEPLAPVAAAQRAGLPLPTRGELVASVAAMSTRSLTLVEGAGGLLVELGDGGVTLRDVAVDLGAPVLVVVAAGARHAEPHRPDVGSACRPRDSVCRPGDRRVAAPTRVLAEEGNREALAELAPLRAVLPAGAGVA